MLSASRHACSVCSFTCCAEPEIPEISSLSTVIFADVPSAMVLIDCASCFVLSIIPLICCLTSAVAVLICSVSFLYSLGIFFSLITFSEKSPDANCFNICIGASILPIRPVINTATTIVMTSAITIATNIIVNSDFVTLDEGMTTPSFQLLPAISDTEK